MSIRLVERKARSPQWISFSTQEFGLFHLWPGLEVFLQQLNIHRRQPGNSGFPEETCWFISLNVLSGTLLSIIPFQQMYHLFIMRHVIVCIVGTWSIPVWTSARDVPAVHVTLASSLIKVLFLCNYTQNIRI